MHRFLRGARRALLSVVVLSALSACGGGGGGGGGSTPVTPVATNNPPRASILGGGDVRPAADGAAGLAATLGGLVRLDSGSSTDPDGDPLSQEWSLVAKPTGSQVTLTDTQARALQFRPDVMGVYTVALKLSDGRGGATTQQVSINVDNRAPSGNVVVTPVFTAVPTEQPQQSMSIGGTALFDAAQSSDPDGHPVSIRFELTSRPDGSAARLTVDGKQARLEADLGGLYRVKVIGSDGRASFETTYPILADHRAPTPTVTVQTEFKPVPTEEPPRSITVGATVVVDASGSMGSDGRLADLRFELVGKPAGSAAVMAPDNRRIFLGTDLAGTYKVKVTGTDSRGASFVNTHVFVADNRAPLPVMVNSILVSEQFTAPVTLDGTVGYMAQLDSSNSTDPDNNITGRTWNLTSRPAGSATALSATTGASINLLPDTLGDYVVYLTVTDALGARSSKVITVRVGNRRPVAEIGTNSTPQALPAAPVQNLASGTQITLRGGNSVDADGDPLTYLWTIDSRPAGSTAALSSSSAVNPSLTVDRDGTFVIRLRVTDTAGAYSERTIQLNVGPRGPVALVDRARVTMVTGDTARATGALSFDRDGGSLSYQWTLDVRPAGSSATIPTPNQAALSLVPDVAGQYAATVTVSNGQQSASATVELNVIPAIGASATLAFTPLEAHYSASLDKLVLSTASPDALRVVDPFSGSVQTIALPAPPYNFSVSPNGRLAAVIHQGGLATLVDLVTLTAIRTSHTGGSQYEALVDDEGFIMLLAGGANSLLITINGYTGAYVIDHDYALGSYDVGSSRGGVVAGRLNRVFSVDSMSSPGVTGFSYRSPTPATVPPPPSSVPQNNTYYAEAPLSLTEIQDVVVSTNGRYFRTADRQYAGALNGVVNGVVSFSNFAATGESLVVEPTTMQYGSGWWYGGAYDLPTTYKRFTTGLFLPDAAPLPAPVIAGQQSRLLRVFHSTAGRHVLLLQTGGTTPRSSGTSYYVVAR
ncbi:PKD domain-containing protein [Roseateles sp. L2-2]|uniref:PKD domain-containing protein n=1 Tax=Roseateles sp. L2-2 TaxID=3422597 RepID=UPI003D35AE6D